MIGEADILTNLPATNPPRTSLFQRTVRNMAEFIAKQMATRQRELSDDSSFAWAAGLEVFVTISSILLKQILDLQEALAFYEMQFFHEADAGAASWGCEILEFPPGEEHSQLSAPE